MQFIDRRWKIWECACGKGNLSERFRVLNFDVVATDVQGVGTYWLRNFLDWHPDAFDCIITNPPFSLKDEFIARCYLLSRPFALLLPITAIGGVERQRLYRKYGGLQIMMLGGRVKFETPSGEGTGAWQEHAWFTWGLNLPSELTFVALDRSSKR